MVSSSDILNAIRELANTKQLDKAELHGLLSDGIFAALAKSYGPTVQAEVEIDEGTGDIHIVRLRTVVDGVTDPSREISLEEARSSAERFEPGAVMQYQIALAQSGRNPVQAATHRIIHRVPARARSRTRHAFATRAGALLSGEVQHIERGKLV